MTPEAIIESIDSLPASTRVLPQLQSLLRDSQASLDDIIELLKLDANLVAQIIRISNSSYYGASSPCAKIQDAVKRVGYQEVYRLIGALAARDVFASELVVYGQKSGDLWKQSIVCATMMRLLSEWVNEDADTAYTSGLLHALGKVALDQYHSKYGIDGYTDGTALNPELEKQILGFSHAVVAARLLEKWQFAPEICLPVLHQQDPQHASEKKELTWLLFLCVQSVSDMQQTLHGFPGNFTPDTEILVDLGISPDEFTDAAMDAQNAVEWLSSTL